MKAYKEYMDRIRVDEEQHDKLLEAVRAAEAAQNKETVPEPAKVRRFPLKTLGLIASAAAVIILVVGVFPGQRTKQADSINTAVPNATEAMAAEHPVEAPNVSARPEESAKTDLASLSEAYPVDDGSMAATSAHSHSATIDFSLAPEGGTKNQGGTASPQATAQTDADQKTAALAEIRSLIETMIPGMRKAETAEQNGNDPDENVCSFLIGENEYVYSPADGVLRSEGLEYVLTPAEKSEINTLLESYFSDR